MAELPNPGAGQGPAQEQNMMEMSQGRPVSSPLQPSPPPSAPSPPLVAAPSQPVEDIEMREAREARKTNERRSRSRRDVMPIDPSRRSERIPKVDNAKKEAERAKKEEAERIAKEKKERQREKERAARENRKAAEELKKQHKHEEEQRRAESFKRALETDAHLLLKETRAEARKEMATRVVTKLVGKRERSSSASSSASESSDNADRKHRMLIDLMKKKIHDKMAKAIEHIEKVKKENEKGLMAQHKKLMDCIKYLPKKSREEIGMKYWKNMEDLDETHDEAIRRLRSVRDIAINGLKITRQNSEAATAPGPASSSTSSSGLANAMGNLFNSTVAGPAAAQPAAGPLRTTTMQGGTSNMKKKYSNKYI